MLQIQSTKAIEYLFEGTTNEKEFQDMDDLIPIRDCVRALELAQAEAKS